MPKQALDMEPELDLITSADVQDGELGITVDGEFRPIRYLGMVVYGEQDGQPPAAEVEAFKGLYRYCVNEGKLAHGQLGPLGVIRLAVVDGRTRWLLLVYAASDFTNVELNEWLGVDCFYEEGGLPGDQWPLAAKCGADG